VNYSSDAAGDADQQPRKVSNKDRCGDIAQHHNGPKSPQDVKFPHDFPSGCRNQYQQARLADARTIEHVWP
jgi:hypothetical protein